MSVEVLTYIIVGFTFAVYIGIALWARARTTEEFYVARGSSSSCYQWLSYSDRLDVYGLISRYGRGYFI